MGLKDGLGPKIHWVGTFISAVVDFLQRGYHILGETILQVWAFWAFMKPLFILRETP